MLFKEVSDANIHRWLVNVYRKSELDISILKRMVWRVNGTSIEKGESDLSDRLCSVKLATVVNEDTVKQTNALLTAERRITITKFYESFQVNHGIDFSLVWSLSSWKVCAKLVPTTPTDSIKKYHDWERRRLHWEPMKTMAVVQWWWAKEAAFKFLWWR